MDHTKGAGRFAHQLIVAINLALTKMYIPSRLEAPDRPQTSKQYAQIGPMAPRDRRPGKTNHATPCRHLSLVLFRAFPPRAPNAGQWNNTG